MDNMASLLRMYVSVLTGDRKATNYYSTLKNYSDVGSYSFMVQPIQRNRFVLNY